MALPTPIEVLREYLEGIKEISTEDTNKRAYSVRAKKENTKNTEASLEVERQKKIFTMAIVALDAVFTDDLAFTNMIRHKDKKWRIFSELSEEEKEKKLQKMLLK